MHFYWNGIPCIHHLNRNAFMHEQTTIDIHEEEVPKLVYPLWWGKPVGRVCRWQDSPDQCPMPINADQNHGIDPKCLSMPIIADQCRSIPLNSSQIERNWEELIGIDRHWSEFINIGINARIFIGIDRHWSALGIESHWRVQRHEESLMKLSGMIH